MALCSFNDANTLKRTIESLLYQDVLGILHIVDDGSTDRTQHVLEEFNNNQIQIHKNPKNIGLAASLNHILNVSEAKYIARIDADDEMVPGRLRMQMEFLEHNQHIHVLGTNAMCIDGNLQHSTQVPLSHEDIRKKLMWYNCMLHPTVMLRRQFVLDAGGYDTSYMRCQDYELWLRLLSKRGRIHNLENISTKIHVRHQKTWKNIVNEFFSLVRIAIKYKQVRIFLYANYSFLYNLKKILKK